jgi:chorismate dehydratase
MSEDEPKLRMAPMEAAVDLARRVEHERRAHDRQRETNLEQTLAPFRVGSVKALNAVPLTRGIEDQVVYATPAKLAEMLREDQLDAALVSLVEVLFTGRYDLLDGVGIACLGEVQSVFLAHRRPVEEATEIFCDPASLTSVELLRVLLAERGLKPLFKPLPGYDFSVLPDYALLIGDNALDFALGPHEHAIWDLGQAWFELTKLPFVFAGWALRRDMDTTELRRHLRDAHDFGLDTLDSIVQNRPEYTYEFRKDYLGWHVHYHLGADERRGIARFIDLLRKHSNRPVHEPRFLS